MSGGKHGLGAAAAVSVGVAALLTAARPAAADERLVLGAGVAAVQRTAAGTFNRPLLGPTVSGTFLELRRETWRLRPGFDVQLSNTFRSDGLWMGDISIAWVATLALTEKAANPFVSFGPDVAYVAADGVDSGWAVGVRADVGIHGIVLDWLYWRAKVGFVAAGVAGMRSELLVGHAFD